MKRKVKGVILLVVGFYLFFGNTIITLLLPFDPYIPHIPNPYGIEPPPIDTITYWKLWFMQIGWQTTIIVIIGLLLIIFGSRYFIFKKDSK